MTQISKNLATVMAISASKELHKQCTQMGQCLAEVNEQGIMLAVGEKKPGDQRRRWFLVLATNDVADHLETFAKEQAEMRAAAAKQPGTPFEVLTHIGNSNDADPLLQEAIRGLLAE